MRREQCQGGFRTREGLATRFGQLAELRNGIRHSRTVDEVTRKDGEAALLWFKQVLQPEDRPVQTHPRGGPDL